MVPPAMIAPVVAAVPDGAPPTAVIPAESDPKGERASGVAEPKAPAIPRVVAHMEAPGGRPGVVDGSVPSGIVVAGAVDDRAAVDVAAGVTWRITDVDDFGRRVVHVNVLHIVDRTAWGDRADLLRDHVGDYPGTLRIIRDEPDRLAAGIILTCDPDHGGAGVHRIQHLRVFDRFELRLAIIGHVQGGVPIDGRRLWYLVIQDRFLRLQRARYPNQ